MDHVTNRVLCTFYLYLKIDTILNDIILPLSLNDVFLYYLYEHFEVLNLILWVAVFMSSLLYTKTLSLLTVP